MIIFIYLCILVLNILTIFLTYRFLGQEMDKKQKLIFIVVGIAIMYATVAITYALATKGIDLGASSDTGKNLITFTFVPVNGILLLPFLASSYKKFKLADIQAETLKKRFIISVVALFVILVIEFFYFKDIQNGILSIIQAK